MIAAGRQVEGSLGTVAAGQIGDIGDGNAA
jgi:hypothetical protein